jgi:hypothetical protein
MHMTARLAIEADGATSRNARPGAWESDANAAAARYRERLSMPSVVEAIGTLATIASFLFALGLIAGEWLGDAGVAGVADAVARTIQAAMPHVAEGSLTAVPAGS